MNSSSSRCQASVLISRMSKLWINALFVPKLCGTSVDLLQFYPQVHPNCRAYFLFFFCTLSISLSRSLSVCFSLSLMIWAVLSVLAEFWAFAYSCRTACLLEGERDSNPESFAASRPFPQSPCCWFIQQYMFLSQARGAVKQLFSQLCFKKQKSRISQVMAVLYGLL